MSELVYFKQADGRNLAPAYIREKSGLEVPNPRAGEPDPLVSLNIAIPVPVMAGNDVVETSVGVKILPLPQLGPKGQSVDKHGVIQRARIIPGTRVIETDHPAVAEMLQNAGFEQTSPPEKTTSAPAPGGKE